jgi:hypothetical protein
MRTMLARGVGLGIVVTVAVVLGACATSYSHPNKKMSREDVAVDVLDCNKAAVLKYKAARISDKSTYEERQKASAAANAAGRRCLEARGWKKNQ